MVELAVVVGLLLLPPGQNIRKIELGPAKKHQSKMPPPPKGRGEEVDATGYHTTPRHHLPPPRACARLRRAGGGGGGGHVWAVETGVCTKELVGS